jgi:hypothetical protein
MSQKSDSERVAGGFSKGARRTFRGIGHIAALPCCLGDARKPAYVMKISNCRPNLGRCRVDLDRLSNFLSRRPMPPCRRGKHKGEQRNRAHKRLLDHSTHARRKVAALSRYLPCTVRVLATPYKERSSRRTWLPRSFALRPERNPPMIGPNGTARENSSPRAHP